MSREKPSSLLRYGAAVFLIGLATLVRVILGPVLGEGVPFILYFPIVVVCAWLGGLWMGFLATGLGGLIAWYLFMPTYYSFAFADPAGPVQLALFALAGVLISFLAEDLHKARRTAEESRADEHEQRERLRVTLASIGDAVIATDREGRVTFMNSVAEGLTGWREEEAHGRALKETFHIINEDTRAEVENPIAKVFREGSIVGLANHTVLIARDQTERPIDDSGAPIRSADGRIIGAVLVFRDITQRRRSEEALARLGAIVESSDDAIVGKNLKSIITSWNAGAERIFGYTAEEVKGKNISILIPPERLDEETEIIERLKRGERIEHYETVRVRKDGRKIEVSLSISPIKDRNGRVIGAAKIARDITERKRAEEALRESEERFRTLANSAPVMVWVSGRDKLCTFFNQQWLDFTGRTMEQEIGDGWAEGVHSEDFERCLQIYFTAFDAREEFEMEYRLRRRDGEYRWVLDKGLPLYDSKGTFTGYIGSCMDITDRKRQAEEREYLLRREQEASRLKDEFLATVSHELRTPLNAMLGWSRMLLDGKLDEERTRQALQTIERNARSQAQLIEDLLDVSRIITGNLRLDVRPVMLSPVIEAALDSVRPMAEAKGVRLQTTLDSQGGPVAGDFSRLQQVVWNLLSNAIKFTPKGGRVQVRLERSNSQIEIVVSDTGQGISPEFLPHVFDRFRQADSSSTRKHGGLGLGLAIVRHLVELHGGAVAVSSAGEGQGATFMVRLPLMAAHPELVKEKRVQPRAEAAEVFEFHCQPRLEAVRVLVVDDESDARQLLKTILERCGAEVKDASSASEGLAIIKEWKPRVLVSDIGMPGEDGYSFIQKVRQWEREAGQFIPALALTAYARSEDRMRALASGYQMHVPKPVQPVELTLVVASLAGLAKG
jgi:PAS domain S-box-containing protein